MTSIGDRRLSIMESRLNLYDLVTDKSQKYTQRISTFTMVDQKSLIYDLLRNLQIQIPLRQWTLFSCHNFCIITLRKLYSLTLDSSTLVHLIWSDQSSWINWVKHPCQSITTSNSTDGKRNDNILRLIRTWKVNHDHNRHMTR